MIRPRTRRTQELTLPGAKRDAGALAYWPKWPKDLRRLSHRLATRCVGERLVGDAAEPQKAPGTPQPAPRNSQSLAGTLVQKLTPRSAATATVPIRRNPPSSAPPTPWN